MPVTVTRLNGGWSRSLCRDLYAIGSEHSSILSNDGALTLLLGFCTTSLAIQTREGNTNWCYTSTIEWKDTKNAVSNVKEKKYFTLNYCVLLSQREEKVMNELDRDKK